MFAKMGKSLLVIIFHGCAHIYGEAEFHTIFRFCVFFDKIFHAIFERTCADTFVKWNGICGLLRPQTQEKAAAHQQQKCFFHKKEKLLV